jgi:hypothetical protein
MDMSCIWTELTADEEAKGRYRCRRSHRYNDCVVDYLTWIYEDAENRLRKFHVCDHAMQKHLQFNNEEGCYDATIADFSHRWACEADYTTLLRWTLTEDHYGEQGNEEEA